MGESAESFRPEKAQEKKEVPEPPPRSVPGVSAIQGLSASTESAQPDARRIQSVAPGEFVAKDIPPLTSQAKNDLELSAQRAMAAKATHYHDTSEKGSRISEYRRLRSEITEDLACDNIQNGVRADTYSRSGTNFTGYDIFGSQEACQVKAYTLHRGEPRYGQYHTDFKNIINPNSRSNLGAEKELKELEQNQPERWTELKPHLPAGVAEVATPEQASQGLAESSTMRIPADQVERVRQDLKKQILEDPQKYGLDPASLPPQAEKYVDSLLEKKVLPIDPRFQTAHFQEKAAVLSHLRDLNLRQLASRS